MKPFRERLSFPCLYHWAVLTIALILTGEKEKFNFLGHVGDPGIIRARLEKRLCDDFEKGGILWTGL